ncbi:hypothetical protein [Staphylococcus debuckii]|uniref:Uncharacterized protein n=1 Tax=Staphylococcus debuckii TaxID=2044912 RepID=A0ABU9F073_9STAP
MSKTEVHSTQNPFVHLNKFLSANEDYRTQEDNQEQLENQWLSNEHSKNIFKKAKSDIKDKGYI